MEFFSEGVVLDAISFQHGKALRWGGYGDAPLANTALVTFLAERGVKEPLEAVMESELQAEDAEAWRRACSALLPPRLKPLVSDDSATDQVSEIAGTSAPDLMFEIERELPNRLAYVSLMMQLLGAKPSSWGSVFEHQGAFERALQTVTPEELVAISAISPRSPQMEEGLSRLLLAPNPPDGARSPQAQGLVVELATKALTRPWALDRFKALSALHKSRDERATAALRGVLSGAVAMSTGHRTTPDGAIWTRYQGTELESAIVEAVPRARPEWGDLRAAAAWALILRGDVLVIEELTSLRAKMSGRDLLVLDGALARIRDSRELPADAGKAR